MNIEPTRYYSLLETQKFTKIKSRQYLTKYIKEKKLAAFTTGGDEINVGTRYSIRGSWIIDFMDRYKKGLVQYRDEELKTLYEQAVKDLK